jgi:hypothetical protein
MMRLPAELLAFAGSWRLLTTRKGLPINTSVPNPPQTSNLPRPARKDAASCTLCQGRKVVGIPGATCPWWAGSGLSVPWAPTT